MPVQISKSIFAAIATAALFTTGPALAAGSHSGGHAGEQAGSGHGHAGTLAFGEPGKASEASRTVEIVMGDNYFEPESLEIRAGETVRRSEEHTSELQSLMRISYAVFFLKKKKNSHSITTSDSRKR